MAGDTLCDKHINVSGATMQQTENKRLSDHTLILRRFHVTDQAKTLITTIMESFSISSLSILILTPKIAFPRNHTCEFVWFDIIFYTEKVLTAYIGGPPVHLVSRVSASPAVLGTYGIHQRTSSPNYAPRRRIACCTRIERNRVLPWEWCCERPRWSGRTRDPHTGWTAPCGRPI